MGMASLGSASANRKIAPIRYAIEKVIASKAWKTTSPIAGGVCIIRLAMRPAKSLSNQLTDCPNTCLWALYLTKVPTFGSIELFCNKVLMPWIRGLNVKIKTATKTSSILCVAQNSAGVVSDSMVINRPRYQIIKISMAATRTEKHAKTQNIFLKGAR